MTAHPVATTPTRASGRPTPAGRRPPLLVVERLAVTSRSRSIGPFDLAVRAGEIVGLVGPNGSGKTSCLRLALGLDPASAGSARLDGREVTPWHPPVGVGIVLEADGCYPWLTGRANLDLFASVLGATAGAVDAALGDAGLEPAADRAVRTYSRGMRQRLAIARARLGSPRLLVLDEPTVALDVDASAWLVEVLAHDASRGTAVLVATHDAELLDALDARVVTIERGTTT